MLKLPLIFCDDMVLQRRKEIKIWGCCDEESIIRARLNNVVSIAKIQDNSWEITFPPMEACYDTTLEIWTDMEHMTFVHVNIGEVWVAAGQSNMQFYLRYDAERKNAVENEGIRMFDYPKVAYEGQLEEYDYSDFGYWRSCTEKNLDYYSSVAYYFALSLEEIYQVPIGIIGCNWGGTPACTWMDPHWLEGTPGTAWLDDYREKTISLDVQEYERRLKKYPNYQGKPFENPDMEKMMYGMPDEEWGVFMQNMIQAMDPNEIPPVGPKSEQRPGALFENMVKKLAPYTVRGILWYQGENDESKADIYDVVFSQLIHCWRDLWKEELPFLFVQLAPFGYWGSPETYPLLRKQQEKVARQEESVWMTSIMDLGERLDIHPKKKRKVGERLALLAREHVYGEEICGDSPEYQQGMGDEQKIRLLFRYAKCLTVEGEKIQSLQLYVNGKECKTYQTSLHGNELEIVSEEFHKGDLVEVKFAEMAYCVVNLYNEMKLPVKPFSVKVKIQQQEG